MTMSHEELVLWLEADEAASRSNRAERLARVLDLVPIPERGFLLFGGMASFQTFTELRLAYIHGLYLSTVLLALACIEQDLAGNQHASGRNAAARATLDQLLQEAIANGEITEEEFAAFDHLRQTRNSYTHYRTPTHPQGWSRRAMTTDSPMEDLLEADAVSALAALGTYMRRRELTGRSQL